ncbi:helix-turn-helix domain-containing protein [Desulfocurvibacter africanus]|uniref:helix-turn-helix domain-containing protein n=1 Tax=Desulfocurvibacter africanus TaxID=873 RepID=UPI0004216400|nr:helix-turn-helix transcriptional regulator [Desulfocurvibacter africanus]
MLARTKKLPTSTIELCFVGPKAQRQKAVAVLRSLGFVDASESTDWRKTLGFTEAELPGAVLVGARAKEGITQRELSAKTGIPQRHISEMENAKRPIGRENARKLGEALNVSYRIFL